MLPFLDFDNARFPIQGGLLQRRGGTVRHDAVAWGYARGADSRGVDIIQNCEVTGIRRENGRVDGRRDEPRASSAAASWRLRRPATPRASPTMADLKLPIESHVLQAFVSEGLKPFIDGVVTFGAGHFYVSQSDKGGLVFGGDIDGYNSYAQRGNLATVEHVAEAGVAMIPALSRVRVLRSWGGVMDMSHGRLADHRPHPDRQSLSECRLVLRRLQGDAGLRLLLRASDRQGTNRTRLRRAFRLDRFERGYTIDEKGVGAQPNLH